MRQRTFSAFSRGRFRLSAAFSLVEVTLAIGVVAFAFVSLLALLPSGMNIFREAMDTTVTAQIAQRIATELENTDFYTLMTKANLEGADPVVQGAPAYGALPRRYFDDQGNEVRVQGETPSLQEQVRILYNVHVRLSREKQLPGGGVASDGSDYVGSRNLAAALIQVVNNPGGKELQMDETTQSVDAKATKLPLQTYTAFISRSGSESRRK